MMKKLFVLVIACGLSHFAIAQKQTSPSGNALQKEVKTELTVEQKMQTIQNCPELLNQLVTKFGKNFTTEDQQVMDQLRKNAKDESIAPVIRKISIYLVAHSKSN